MAGKRLKIEFLGPPSKRYRYGRATVTISEWSNIGHGHLGDAIAGFKRDEIDPDSLCRELISARIRRHSPTFELETADQTRLLEMVASTSTHPTLDSADPDYVAARLVEAADAEAEEFRLAVKQMRKGGMFSILSKPGILDPNRFRSLMPTSDIAASVEKVNRLIKDDAMPSRLSFKPVFGAEISKMIQNKGLGSSSLFPTTNFALSGGALQSALGLQAKNRALLDSVSIPSMGSDMWGLKSIMSSIDPKVFAPNLGSVWSDHLGGILGDFRKAAQQLAEAHWETLPENWRDLETSELDKIIQLMQEEGLGLAWAPRPEIIQELIEADGHTERVEILERSREEIMDDAEEVFDSICHPGLIQAAEAGIEAIDNFRKAGTPGPPQAYASAISGHIVHRTLGFENFGPVRSHFRDLDARHVPYGLFPLVAVGKAWVKVNERLDKAGDGFNRNTSVHWVGESHTVANLMTVLLFLSGLLKEFELSFERSGEQCLEAVA